MIARTKKLKYRNTCDVANAIMVFWHYCKMLISLCSDSLLTVLDELFREWRLQKVSLVYQNLPLILCQSILPVCSLSCLRIYLLSLLLSESTYHGKSNCLLIYCVNHVTHYNSPMHSNNGTQSTYLLDGSSNRNNLMVSSALGKFAFCGVLKPSLVEPTSLSYPSFIEYGISSKPILSTPSPL